MLYRIIDAGDVPLLIRAFMDSYELVAPVECDQGHIFDTIDDPNDVVLDYSTTIASPKKYFLPPREILFKFDVAQNDVDAYELDVKPRVLFGVHPCDMNAIEKLDSVFLKGRTPTRITARAAKPRSSWALDARLLSRASAIAWMPTKRLPDTICSCKIWVTASGSPFLRSLQRKFWKNRPRCVKLPTKIAPLSPPLPVVATRHSLLTFPLCKMLPCLWTRITPIRFGPNWVRVV